MCAVRAWGSPVLQKRKGRSARSLLPLARSLSGATRKVKFTFSSGGGLLEAYPSPSRESMELLFDDRRIGKHSTLLALPEVFFSPGCKPTLVRRGDVVHSEEFTFPSLHDNAATGGQRW